MKHNKTYKYKTGSKKNKTKRGGSSKSKSLPPPPLPSIKSSSQRSFFPPLPPIKPKSPTPKSKSKSPPQTEPKIKSDIITVTYTGYKGDVLKKDPFVPHGHGRKLLYFDSYDNKYEYLGNFEHGKKHDDNGIMLVNIPKNFTTNTDSYYIRGKWENDLQEGFHEMKKIEYFSDIDKPKTKNAPGRIVYYEKGKLAGKKIEKAIEDTIGKKLPDDVFRIMNSYRIKNR